MKGKFASLSAHVTPLSMAVLVVASIVLLMQQLGSSIVRSNAPASAEAEFCGQVEVLKRTTPPVPKLTITPILQNSSLIGSSPDLEYIPIFPGSDEENTERDAIAHATNHIGMRTYNYYPPAGATLHDVVLFYREALSRNGWRPVGRTLPEPVSDEQELDHQVANGTPYYYAWTDPEDRSPWHFYARIVDIVKLPGNRVEVQLEYGRYPDMIKNLSVDPGARNIEISCSQDSGNILNGGLPVTTIHKSYLTGTTPDEVAAYYNTTILPFGWRFFDENMLNRVATGETSDMSLVYEKQAGNINSGDGLIFQGMASYDERGMVFVPMLNITATRTGDGSTKVQLKETIKEQRPASPLGSR